MAFMELYNVVGLVPHADFQRLIDRNNGVSQLLLSHFMAAHVLLYHLTIAKVNTRENETIPLYKVFKGWMKGIKDGLEPSLRKYNEWPFGFVVNLGAGSIEEKIAEARMATVKFKR